MNTIECFCFRCFSNGIKKDSIHEKIDNFKVKCLKCGTLRPAPDILN